VVTPYRVKIEVGSVGVRFSHVELPHYEGKDVIVAYDVMNYEKVWVYTLSGELICVADHVADSPYSSVAANEAAQSFRDDVAIKRKQKDIQAIRDASGLLLEHTEAEVIPLQRFKPVQEEPVDQPQLSREEALRRLHSWGEVEEEGENPSESGFAGFKN
jgi:hypothetical protein